MKFHNKLLLLAVAFGATGLTMTVQAQESAMVVEWADSEGNVIVNALRDAIVADSLRPDDRVYVLKRGGFYWNTERIQVDGFHLRIHGETADEADPGEAFVCGENFDEDCGPAIIQRAVRENGTWDGQMINTSGSGSHITMDHVWLMGQVDNGVTTSWQPFRMNATDSRYVFDYVIFDRNDWQHLGNAGANTSLYVTNSLFRNLHGPAQQWEGMLMQFDAGADTVIIENNTAFNIGFTLVKNEAVPVNYFRMNHNTFVNVGRTISSGAIWKEGYITNNIFVNYFWHGEQPSEYEDPNRVDPDGSFLQIWDMPARFGTNLDRRIVYNNNSFWRDETIAAGMPDDIQQALIANDTTLGWIAAYDGMVMENNFMDANPGLTTYPAEIIPDMITNITELRAGNSGAPKYNWDPGRDEECPQCNIWPVPEDYTYTNTDLMTGGTDGLPLGDLNWYPDAKADFLANKDQYVADIEALAGARLELNIISSVEADEGTLDGAAEVAVVEGGTYFEMQSGGFINWEFDIAADGSYDLVLATRLAFGTKGQHTRIDGGRIKNQAFTGNGEFVFDANVLGSDWVDYLIAADTIWVPDNTNFVGPEVLDFTAGTHTLNLQPSWGFQHFRGFYIVDRASRDTVVAKMAPDATSEGMVTVCEDSDFCPTGFKSVAMDAGGTVGLSMDFPSDGDYTTRIFYSAESTVSGELLLDGEVVSTLTFAAGGSSMLADVFPAGAGKSSARSVTIRANGPVNVDLVQLIEVRGGSGVANEQSELPEGYALEQNYPNPFNPTTAISYTLGESSHVTLTIFDVTGRQVAQLVDGVQPSGTYHVNWNALDVTSGVYLYRLQTPVGQRTRSMVVLK
jgi:hypothetical protein